METTKIMLVDDHQVVRDGIKALVNNMENFTVIGEAGDEKELWTKLGLEEPDILIMDISLPGKSGIEITRELKKEYPGIRVLILSMYTSEDFIFNAVKAGAHGYLPKNTSKKELNNALIEISRGGEYFSEPISNIILKSYIKQAQGVDAGIGEEKSESLSSRETEVLKLFAEGKSNKEIAESLCISIRTVESHKNHIMQKLHLKSTVDLIKFAIRKKIINI
ncbi:MAG: response regulator transcription factor [Bacteroidota bacterium]|nr:response regulator transcription factor [Bacteroidota bacterium]